MKTDEKVYKCRGIVPGSGEGEAVVSRDAMCFYLCDPETGVVVERNHAIQGRSIAGKILIVQSGKGSSVVQVDGFYQLWAKGTLPKAIIVKETEPVIVSAAVVMGTTMVDRVDADPFEIVEDGDWVSVDADAGEIRIRKKQP